MVDVTSRSRVLAVAIATVLAGPALVPQAGAAEGGEARPVGLEEVVVTARKRAEAVQETPVSMVAFSENSLKQASIDSFKELANATPNFEINGGIPNGGGSAAQIYIRGVGQDDYSFPNEPGVGLYIDGVYVARSAGGDFGFMDIERIEILRGPQGTLYGRNTIGGAVNIVTAKPDGSFGAEAGLTVGDYDRVDLYARMQFPLSDTVSAKFAVGTRSRDGLGENIIGESLGELDQQMARGALRFQPNDGLDILWQADWMKQRQNGPAGSMVAYVPNGTGEALINPLFSESVSEEFGLEPPFDEYGPAWVKTLAANGKGVYDSGGAEDTRDWADIWGTSLTIDKVLGDDYTLKSVTAYRDAEIDVRRDSEHTPFRIVRVDNPEETSQFTQEFQLNGTAAGGRLEYVVGLFGLIEEGKSQLYAPLIEGTYELISLDLVALINTDYDASSYAVFGEGTYMVTDRVGITLGGRYTVDDKEYVYGLERPPSGTVPLPPTKLQDDWSEFLPKLGVEFQVNEDVLLFANASRGYKAGGYNSRALSGNPPQAYDPEYINAYEIGIKTAWADDRAFLNIAAFYNDYEDIQLLSVVDLGGGNVETVINNAAKGRIIGGEIELTALPHPDFRLGVGLGYLDTEYTEVDEDAQNAGILESNKFINAPELSANVGADWTIGLPGGSSLLLHADMVYRDEQYRDGVNTPQLRADSYTVVNARVTWTSADDKWELAAFGTNLGDEIYITNGVSVLGLEYVEAYYNRPAEWGASVRYRF
jgi:iron complex outermembrane receptor protein